MHIKKRQESKVCKLHENTHMCICVHIAAKKLCYYPAFSQLMAEKLSAARVPFKSSVAQNADAFLLMTLAFTSLQLECKSFPPKI